MMSYFDLNSKITGKKEHLFYSSISFVLFIWMDIVMMLKDNMKNKYTSVSGIIPNCKKDIYYP